MTCTLPAAILVIVWWQRGRIRRRDVLSLAPFFVVGFALGLLTVFMEVHNVGARGSGWSMGYASRLLIAGRAVTFYATKLVLPWNLMFFYPRWTIDPLAWQQWLFPAAVLLAISALWLLRNRIGRGPVACVLLYVGTLFPALGFFDVYPMRYSYVADHFQYHASLWLIAGCCAAAVGLMPRLSTNWRRLATALGVGVLALFAGMVWRRGYEFQGLESLWRETIRKNPGAWMAHNNLANTLVDQHRQEEAFKHYMLAIGINPDEPEPHYNLANALVQWRRYDEAALHYKETLRCDPRFSQAENNWGAMVLNLKVWDEAESHFRNALRIKPDNWEAMGNLGRLLVETGRPAEGISYLERRVELAPSNPQVRVVLGRAHMGMGNYDKASEELSLALRMQPDHSEARNLLNQIQASQRQAPPPGKP